MDANDRWKRSTGRRLTAHNCQCGKRLIFAVQGRASYLLLNFFRLAYISSFLYVLYTYEEFSRPIVRQNIFLKIEEQNFVKNRNIS